MTLFVPFDGSELAEAALVRAREFGTAFDERVVAVTAVPEGNAEYARERGWLDPEEEFDVDVVVSRLREQVTDLCPGAQFRHEVVDRYAPPGAIATRVRDVVRDEAAMVFVGSDNAGRLVTSLSSVGEKIVGEETYDVVIVRRRTPSRVASLRESGPSEFYDRD